TETLRIKFKDAGHILGSAFVDIKNNSLPKSRKILFTGDIGRPARPILRDPVQVFNVDYLVIESTYGDRLHDPNPPEKELARIINESINRGGVLVIPSFAVGRTQELLFCIRELEERGAIPPIPVFVDSPMAIDATLVFEKWKGDYDLETKILQLNGKKILQTRQIKFCRSTEESKQLNEQKKPAIIISASGMAEGGRILHHLLHRLPYPQNTIFFIGFQAEGTRGRAILEGNTTVKIHGQPVPIRAKVENISGFSAHGDYNEILAWLMGFNRPPLKTFIVHGETPAAISLAEKITYHLGWEVVIPQFKESFEIDL
ncbi:MAG: MBL fold metallo-hydrolase, partial [Desulfobacterota bacterium]|nr:MBL fold metallo-hydrolase [Thermodesulfobacteriota bacterium]